MSNALRSLFLGIAGATCLLAAQGCTSLAEARRHQAVAWQDGGRERVAVWVRGGGTDRDQPWRFVLELIGTPLLIPVETWIALEYAASDDARLTWGALGWLASLLPGFTCMPVEEHLDNWLHLRDELRLPASERERLRRASASESVEWLIGHYQQQFPGNEDLPRRVRGIVASVELEPPALESPPAPAPARQQ